MYKDHFRPQSLKLQRKIDSVKIRFAMSRMECCLLTYKEIVFCLPGVPSSYHKWKVAKFNLHKNNSCVVSWMCKILPVFFSSKKSPSCYYLSSAKNCEDHTGSFQSAVLIHEIHVFTSYMYIDPYGQSGRFCLTFKNIKSNTTRRFCKSRLWIENYYRKHHFNEAFRSML